MVDVSVDAGESFGPWRMGRDEELFEHVTSANLACGFHAGDPATIRKTAALARRHGVQVGAHPGLRDLLGFGRREMAVTPEEIYADVLYQLGALAAVVRAEGLPLGHISPHGALGWMTWRDGDVARAVVGAARDFDSALAVVALPGTELAKAAQEVGLRTVFMGFPERGYGRDGRLAPRGSTGAVIIDPEEAAARAVTMVTGGGVRSVEGEWLALRAGTLLIHGDNPLAPEIARTVRQALEVAGIAVRGF